MIVVGEATVEGANGTGKVASWGGQLRWRMDSVIMVMGYERRQPGRGGVAAVVEVEASGGRN